LFDTRLIVEKLCENDTGLSILFNFTDFLENDFTNLTTITIIQDVIGRTGLKSTQIIHKWAEMKQLL
jgi:hypothetical protein